jgi:3-dehydroquinate dehydratase
MKLENNLGNVHNYFEMQQDINNMMEQRLQFIETKIDELNQNKLNTEKQSEILLTFDDKRRMIFWTGGSVRLSKNQYLLIKTIYNNGLFADLDIIEKNVWDFSGNKDKMFISRHAIFELVNRTRISVYDANFPYEIVSVIEKQTECEDDKHHRYNELQGYALERKK